MKMHTKVCPVSLKGRDHSGELDVDGSVVFNRCGLDASGTGYRTSGGLL
jgi:hypothetical protein